MASSSCTLLCSVSHFRFLLLLISMLIQYSDSQYICPISFNFSCRHDNVHNQFSSSHFSNPSLRKYNCGGPCELTCEEKYTTIKCTYGDEEPTHRVLEIDPTNLTITIAADYPDGWLYDPCEAYIVLDSSFPQFNSVSFSITGSGGNETFLGCPSEEESDESRDRKYKKYCRYGGNWKNVILDGPYDFDEAPPVKPGCVKFLIPKGTQEVPASVPVSIPALIPGHSPSEHRRRGIGKLWKYILSVLSVIAITSAGLIMYVIITYRQRRNSKSRLRPSPSMIMSLNHTRSDLEEGSIINGVTVFSYAELQKVTNNFDPERELGEGGFGVVYHGKLDDGREVAVKRMFEKNYRQIEQFKNEIQILTNVRHPNLVTLYGSTSRHSRELLLVYEYIPNGTLSDHLHGRQSKSVLLLWPTRLNIAIQTASALCYLHFKDIIHRDVKSNNILLDKTFVAKVADFGLSRLFPSDVSHVSTAPQGTPGYLDPEYHQCYHLTDRSDVYSFGVVLVELISSREAVDFEREGHEVNLANYAMNRIQGCEFGELVDVNLGYDKSFKVRRMTNLVAELAFRCLQHEREIRPSMEEVLEELKRIESVDYEDLEAEEMGNLMILQRS